MFTEILPSIVKHRCNELELSYIKAAEKCSMSYTTFRNIIHGHTNPRLITIERLCVGLELNPNELLGVSSNTMHSYRVPMRVHNYRKLWDWNGYSDYPICPQCQTLFDNEYQAYCGHCGQRLSWKDYNRATCVKKKE